MGAETEGTWITSSLYKFAPVLVLTSIILFAIMRPSLLCSGMRVVHVDYYTTVTN